VFFGRSDAGADYERLIFVQDRTCGLRAVIVLHSLRRGPAFGGIRRRLYADEDSAILDALLLAETMTLKCALAGLPAGGGKAVILDHSGLDREAIYRAMGRAVAGLAGTYVCGPDIGTDDAELAIVRHETDFVSPEANTPAAATVRGILSGLRGTLRVLDGNENLAGRHMLIQGLGSIGLRLATELIALGARVSGCDVTEERCLAGRDAGVEIIPEAGTYIIAADVFMPCALGSVIGPDEARAAPWKAVCGAANNQLASPEAGRILVERGILMAPDLVVNAGAVIEGVYTYREGQTPQARQRAEEAIDAIADRTECILRQAIERGEPPEDVARFGAWEMLKSGD